MPDSIALIKFQSSLALANELLSIEAAYPDPPPPTDAAKVGGLRGGAAVLMVAAFEAYLKSGIAELLMPLLGPPHRPWQSLPVELKVASVFESLENAMRGSRHGASGEKADRLPAIMAAAQKIVANHIDPDALSQTKSNPGPATLERLLKAVGIKSVFPHLRQTFEAKWGHQEAGMFVRDKLDEIVHRRHKVAHTADSLSIGRGDLVTAIKFLRCLAETIDSEMQLHVASL